MSKPGKLTAEQILARLVAFDTVSRNSNRACIDFIRDYLDGFGIKSDIIASDDGQKACLWATVGSGEAGVALAGHTDVVPVDGQSWNSDPFTLTERDGKLHARGSADMKGFIACALAFVPEFLAAKQGCFHLAFTSDEETDMSGAVRLTDYLAAKDIHPRWFWVGEPTGLQIVNEHKGVAAFRTHVTGVSGHSGQPDKGLNAISIAGDFMEIVEQAARVRKEKPFSPSRFDPPYTTFNLAKIAGGTADNIIAEHCELVWQVRAHPGESAATIAQQADGEAQKKFAKMLTAFAPQARIDTCTCFDIPPFLADADNEGERALKKRLGCDETHAVGFATEAGIFQKRGSAAVVCGPGSIEQAHQPNEFIDKKHIPACVDLMRAVLLSSDAL
ncbi:MAG: acetylornithine deacetylase [Alphaproteobacteria bacterium]|nr:acetylornithine deacetylase [Alphaproteobacteria bacterium]